MADNYLERKMEDYRSGKSVKLAHKKITPTGEKPGKISIDFPPRRVYVTGGAKGIGRAIVSAFCRAGCQVAFCDIDEKAGRQTAQAFGAQFHPLDVADSVALASSLSNVIDRWGGLDIVINNVGVGRFKPFLESTLDEFQAVLDINLKPIFVTSQALARCKVGDKSGGRIINICSTRHTMSEPGTEAYSASKGAVRSITHALMASLAPLGITVNCISPGWIDCSGEQLREIDHAFHPSGRVGIPDDIAQACLYLASPAAAFVNGENITIDGGVTHKMIYPDED